jgi:hypothetical protein
MLLGLMLHRSMRRAGAYSTPNVVDVLKVPFYLWSRFATDATQASALCLLIESPKVLAFAGTCSVPDNIPIGIFAGPGFCGLAV